MIKLLIGGSPCTYWSIAQKNNRETEPSGLGWELFNNYLIAKEKFKPDFFLYENNKSAAQSIKAQIKKELQVDNSNNYYIEINSALVSAQNRQRFYVHNCGDVGQPEDRGILLKDILESGQDLTSNDKSYALMASYDGAVAWNTLERKQRNMAAERIPPYGNNDKARPLERLYANHAGTGEGSLAKRLFSDNPNKQKVDLVAEPVLFQYPHGVNKGGVKRNKTPTMTANGSWADNNHILHPIRVGGFPRQNGELSTSQAMRVYSSAGKSVALSSNGGGMGGKTGLYAIPSKRQTKTYEVKDGLITIKDKQYPIKLVDGYYIIRKLTVKECCRLQTMPDDYCRAVSNSQAYKGLGNGWTAEVIIHILNGALKDVPKDEEIVVLSMYDGIGTGRYCLDKMGFKNVKYYAFEIDKYAKQIATSNYQDIIQCGDAYQVREEDFRFKGGNK